MDTAPEGDPAQSPTLTAAATTQAGLSAVGEQGALKRPFHAEFIRDLMARGATAHSILVSTSTRGGELQTAVSTSLAENTGGVYTSLAAPTALARALTELARAMAAHYDEAKNRYRVVVECDPDNPSASINVEVTRPAVDVHLFADRRANR